MATTRGGLCFKLRRHQSQPPRLLHSPSSSISVVADCTQSRRRDLSSSHSRALVRCHRIFNSSAVEVLSSSLQASPSMLLTAIISCQAWLVVVVEFVFRPAATDSSSATPVVISVVAELCEEKVDLSRLQWWISIYFHIWPLTFQLCTL